MLGPIDYVVVGFKGNKFDGSIADELASAVRSGVIRVIDLVFILKDDKGNVEAGEIEDQAADLREIAEELGMDAEMPLLSEADVEKVARDMDNNTAAGVLVIEQLWAKGLKKAISRANGFLIADGRIHPDVVNGAVQELQLGSAT